jgi:cation:H+ antiporter
MEFEILNLPIFPIYFEFPIDIIALIIAADLIANSAESLSKRFGEGLTGGIIIGFMTTLPETIFVIVATLSGKPDIALGSALGGNIILFTLGIGILGILYILKWKKPGTLNIEYKVEEKYLLLSNFALASILLIGFINIYIGLGLLIVYFLYAFERYRAYRKLIELEYIKPIPLLRSTLYLTLGCILMLIFTERFIKVIEDLSLSLGLPASLISLIITPIISEFEEKLSSFKLILNSSENFTLALLSFIGSKIQNMTILVGFIGIFNQGDLSINRYYEEFLVTIIVTFIALYVLFDRKMGIIESILLIISYFTIIFLLILIS